MIHSDVVTGVMSFPEMEAMMYKIEGEDLYLIKGSADYFFGMILETKFQQGPNGLSDNGDPVVFEFNGDDDLWVYADGVLLLDIGGVHDNLLTV
jgi:hypothetical protein